MTGVVYAQSYDSNNQNYIALNQDIGDLTDEGRIPDEYNTHTSNDEIAIVTTTRCQLPTNHSGIGRVIAWYLPANAHALVHVESRIGRKNDISESSQIKNGTDGSYYVETTAGINTLYTIGKAEYITDASYYIDGVIVQGNNVDIRYQ